MRILYSTIVLFFLLGGHLMYAQTILFDTTLIINKQRFTIKTKDINNNLVLLYAGYGTKIALHDTIDKAGLRPLAFPDFNKDGYADIMLSWVSNNPTNTLYLFDPSSNTFKVVAGFLNYPAAVLLASGSRYYYSYSRAGCSDLNWVSDLFRIKDYKVIPVGHIDGQGCDFNVKANPQVIKIYKVSSDNYTGKLIAKLGYLKYIPHFDDKWNFIKKYWRDNYKKFE